ncbi:MAG: hypothetical protein K2Y18_08035 [Alphaproteobacteria bacterium]|jgi:hypothetical protein|nr:hypothetical protein [Alphaproteobacteria bacterium]
MIKRILTASMLMIVASQGMEVGDDDNGADADSSKEIVLRISSELDLSSISTDPIQDLAIFNDLSSLRSLNFQNRGIKYPEALGILRNLVERKAQLSQLEEINLSENKIRVTKRLSKNDGLVTTLLTILNLRSLKVLDISSNLSKDQVMRYLVDELVGQADPTVYPNFTIKKLKYLDRPDRFSDTLDWNERRITDTVLTEEDHPRSLLSLGRELRTQSQAVLRVLSLKNNDIAYGGFVNLMILISKYRNQFPDLQIIDLSGNKIMFLRKYYETVSPFPSLVDVLAMLSLESLVLNKNPITYEEFVFLRNSTSKAALGRGDIPHFNVTKMKYENSEICLTARGALTPKEGEKD